MSSVESASVPPPARPLSASPNLRDRRYLLVLSHMRSFSTVLCHILGSHPEISGYAEMHRAYFSRIDLWGLVRDVEASLDAPVRTRYVLDKLLYDGVQVAPAVLDRPEVKVLLLVRNAPDTLRSILSMSHATGGPDLYKDPDRVSRYYVERLQYLERYSAHLGGRALYVDAEQVIAAPDRVLAALTSWLELETPLRPSYRTFKLTGVAGAGDPSPNIHAGTLIPDPEVRHRDDVEVPIPRDALDRAVRTHRAFREAVVPRHPLAA